MTLISHLFVTSLSLQSIKSIKAYEEELRTLEKINVDL